MGDPLFLPLYDIFMVKLENDFVVPFMLNFYRRYLMMSLIEEKLKQMTFFLKD